MQTIIIVLISVAALGFALAVISSFFGGALFNISAEAFSRACSNLALIAIALALWPKGKNQ